MAGHRRRRGEQPRLGRDAAGPGGDQRRHERRFPRDARGAGGAESVRPVLLPGGPRAFRGRRRGQQRGQPAGLVPPGTEAARQASRARTRRWPRARNRCAAWSCCRSGRRNARRPGARTSAGVVTGFSQNTTALDLLQATTEAVYQRLALIADLSVGRTCGSRRCGASRRSRSSCPAAS